MMHAPAPLTPVLKTEIRFAGFWRRALAYLIDTSALVGVNSIIYGSAHILAPDNQDVLRNVAGVGLAVGWAYYVLMESSPAQATLGKLALGLYVADLHGDPITFWRAVRRNAYKTLSTLVVFTGWVLAAFTPRKQALHDLLAGTLVLRRHNYFVIGHEPPKDPGEHWDGTRWVASIPPLEGS
jgi:uncharacterized RDD family membrane protein YckC